MKILLLFLFIMLNAFFKSIIDNDRSSIVVCNLEHEIVYMNPAAQKNYEKRGGASLVGKNLLHCHNENSNRLILQVLDWFKKDKSHNLIHTFYSEKQNKDVYMIALRDDVGELIGYYEKHEFRTRDESPFYDFT